MNKTLFAKLPVRVLFPVLLGLGLAACQREEVVEYTIPKEPVPEMSEIRRQLAEARAGMGDPHALAGHSPHGHDHDHDHDHDHAHGHGHPHAHAGEDPRGIPLGGPGAEEESLAYAVPEGWLEQPPGMIRRAGFLVAGADGELADVAVTRFPGDTGGLPANVNRWRNQLGLPSLPPEETKKHVTALSVEGKEFWWIDIPGPDGAAEAQSILGAVHAREGGTWFFKMMGDRDMVESQREAFARFLETVRFGS